MAPGGTVIAMSRYGDRPYEDDEPMSELEFEQQRAGVEPGREASESSIGSPLWVAGLGPTSREYFGSSQDDHGGVRKGIGAKIRSMFGRRSH